MCPATDKSIPDGFLDVSFNPQPEPWTKKQPAQKMSIVPLMIKHLLVDSLESFHLWGSPIHIMQIVGIVRKVERDSKKISYEIMDETGSITAHQWIGIDDKELSMVPIGCYAKIFGSLREQDYGRHIIVMNITKIVSFTDVFEHFLEVTYACMKGEELAPKPNPVEPVHNMEVSEGRNVFGMSTHQLTIYRVIRSFSKSEYGIDKETLQLELSSELHDNFEEILKSLVDEGHVYTTCDENFFKTT